MSVMSSAEKAATRTLLDTSVLVAALEAGHPHHAVARPYLQACHDGDRALVIAAHAVAETFATLTVLPVSPREAERLRDRSARAHRRPQMCSRAAFCCVASSPTRYLASTFVSSPRATSGGGSTGVGSLIGGLLHGLVGPVAAGNLASDSLV